MSSRTEVGDSKLFNSIFSRRMKIGFLDLGTISTAFQILNDMPPFLRINAAGAINVQLPAVTADMFGEVFFLFNTSGSTITLQTSLGAGFSPAITIPTLTGRMVICDGVTWRQVI